MLKCDLLACNWLYAHDNMMDYGWIMINMHEIWWIVWKWKIDELWRKIDELWQMMVCAKLTCKWLLATI